MRLQAERLSSSKRFHLDDGPNDPGHGTPHSEADEHMVFRVFGHERATGVEDVTD